MDPVINSSELIDAGLLIPLARKACGRSDLHLDGWQVQTVAGGVERGSTIY